jgi:uncharacterized repeat protein (TIGR03803 family)
MLAVAAASIVARAQTFSVLYDFGTNTGDPVQPWSPGTIAQGRDGNLYSTAPEGGTGSCGAIFRVTPKGTLSVLYSFVGTNGCFPLSGLTLGTDGNFYGTTSSGGASNDGTIFKITPGGTLTVLHSFAGPDGSYPNAPPIEGTDGNFYGTTKEGGANQDEYGTVYKITPSGKITTLYSFDTLYGSPVAPLVQGTDGDFYGTTLGGAVYKITPRGRFTMLNHFGRQGAIMTAPLIQGRDSNFYGTTTGDEGFAVDGTAFKITPEGKVTVLRKVHGGFSGPVLIAGLVQASDGNFYGASTDGGTTSQGTIFRISPTKPYSYKILYNFDGTTGAIPYASLLQHTNGVLYGDTHVGGTANEGVFYSLNIAVRPFVSLVSNSGKVGTTVEILGQGFKGTTGVAFNGTAATFKVVSGTYLTAKVPSGATTGFITVMTPKRKLMSNKKFRVN